MDKISDIKAEISKFENDTSFSKLRSRWDTDFNLWRMSPYDAGKGYLSFTSSMPKTFAAKVISMLILAKLMIRIPDDVLTKDLREVANNVERFLYGCFNLNDERNSRVPDVATIRAQKAWYACVRGGFATVTFVYTNKKSMTSPEVKVWDLYNTAYGIGDGEVLWAAYTRKASKSQVEQEYGTKIDRVGSQIDVVEFWDSEKFGVFVGDKWVLEPVYHNIGHTPVYIFKAGATPIVSQQAIPDSAVYTGESVFAPIRDLTPQMNKIMSDYLTLTHRGVKSPYVVNTQTGESQIDEDIWQVEKAAKIDLKSGESIQPLNPQTMPLDAAPLVNWISGEFQRATMPFTAYGELGFRLSGYAINQLQGSLETVLQPFVECIERSYFVECRELMQQFSIGQFNPVAVRGRTSKNQAFGYPTAFGISTQDIAGDWYPEVSLTPILPKDDAQRLSMANLATQSEKPLLSMKTARTEYLGVSDADMEASQVALEWSDNLIINRLYQAYMRAVEDGDADRAGNILIELRRFMTTQQPGEGKPVQQPNQQANEEGEIPPAPTGLSSSTMPYEEQGGTPPGAANAVQPPLPFEV